jgi:hypothetical protein
MAGQQFLAHVARDAFRMDAAAAHDWLSRVAHATTEHAVVTRPERRQFGVSVADGTGLWDASFRSIDWVRGEVAPFTPPYCC